MLSGISGSPGALIAAAGAAACTCPDVLAMPCPTAVGFMTVTGTLQQ